MFTRILIVGTNKPQINDFFTQGREFFECITSSLRKEDLSLHLQLAEPTALVCCLNVEKDNELQALAEFAQSLKAKNIPIIIMGTKEGVARYRKIVMVDSALDFGDKYIPPRTLFTDIDKCITDSLKPAEKKRYHILVVDDDPIMLKVIKEGLHDEFDVAVAVGGKTALKFLETRTTDLILLDYEMPELNGIQVLQRLKMEKRTAGIPIIFLTGNSDPEKVKEVLSYKPQGYVLKPVDNAKLIETVEKVLAR